MTHMATRRRSSATIAKSPVKKSTPKVVAKESVTKYQQPVEIKEVTKTPTPMTRPEKPNLSRKDYMDDIKVRWQIHQFETMELWNDIKKGVDFVSPYINKSVEYVKATYNKEFGPKTSS